MNILPELSERWNINCSHRTQYAVPGSPERVEKRFVFKSGQDLFLAEKLFSHTFSQKKEIACVSEYLCSRNIPAARMIPSVTGEYIETLSDGFWQITQFYPETPVARARYSTDTQMGKNAALFLVGLYDESQNLVSLTKKPQLIPVYASEILTTLKKYDPDIFHRVKNIFETAAGCCSEIYHQSFSHGDFHPVNIIWGTDSQIQAVIDWEFCGENYWCYDAANFLSCIGFDDPENLFNPCVQSFIHTLSESGILSFNKLPELVRLMIALRSAWISEWLRKKDYEMQQLELDYIDLLHENFGIIVRQFAEFL